MTSRISKMVLSTVDLDPPKGSSNPRDGLLDLFAYPRSGSTAHEYRTFPSLLSLESEDSLQHPHRGSITELVRAVDEEMDGIAASSARGWRPSTRSLRT